MEKINQGMGNQKMQTRILDKLDEIVEWINKQGKDKSLGAKPKVISDTVVWLVIGSVVLGLMFGILFLKGVL